MTTHEGAGQRDATRVTIRRARRGWDVVELRDGEVVRSVRCHDWHRVERAVGLFEALPVEPLARRPDAG